MKTRAQSLLTEPSSFRAWAPVKTKESPPCGGLSFPEAHPQASTNLEGSRVSIQVVDKYRSTKI